MRFVAVFVGLLASTAALATPTTVQHQGRLLDATGDPLVGMHSATFRLYTSATGGTAVFTETDQLTLDAGYFSTRLGDGAVPLDATLLDGSALYLGISVDGGAELTPRARLDSVPYAVRASIADTVEGEVDAGSILVDGAPVIDSATGAYLGTVDWTHVTGAPPDEDTLGDLACTAGQVARRAASGWECADANGHTHAANAVVSGTLDVARLPIGTTAGTVAAGVHTHAAGDLTTGTIAIGRLPVGTTSTDVAAGDHKHAAADLTSGTLAIARIPVGTTAGTVKAGDAPDADTLAALSCAVGQVAVRGPSGWTCGTRGGVLALELELDEVSATFADTSGLGNAATAPAGGVAAGAGGHAATAAVAFSGGVVLVPAGNSVPDSATVQVEAWVRPGASVAGTQTLLDRPGAYRLSSVGGSPAFSVTTQAATCAVQSKVVTAPGVWYAVVAWYNGQEVVISVNGAERAAPCAGGRVASVAGAHLSLGGVYSGGAVAAPFDGRLDEVRVRTVAPAYEAPCPVGYIEMGPRCISSTTRTTALWDAAATTCFAEGGTLCDAQSMVYACEQRTALGLTIPDNTWMWVDERAIDWWSSTWYQTQHVFRRVGNTCFNVTSSATPSDHTQTWDHGSTSNPYYCCAERR